MEKYKNLSGLSNVSHYELGKDFIDVKFNKPNKDGINTYKYSYMKPMAIAVEHMKQLAIVGRGLNSYISTAIKKNYERKWRS